MGAMSSDDDFDLNEVKPKPARAPLKAVSQVIDLTDDTPHATTRKSDAPGPKQARQTTPQEAAANSVGEAASVISPPPQLCNTFLGLNRKQMEEERLARKRKATSQHASEAPIYKAPKVETKQEAPPSSRLRFVDGAIKTTYVRMVSRQATDITIEEIFEKEHLEQCVLSAFQWDIPWVLQKLRIGKTKLWLVMQANEDEKEHTQGVISAIPLAKCIFPSMAGLINCMHSKLQILFYGTHLRVVVPSANLVPYDWGEVSAMENMIFVQDFAWSASPPSSSFSSELCLFCRAANYPQEILSKLGQYDMSTAKAHFVHSIGGEHRMGLPATGFLSLAKAIEAIDPSLKDNTPQVDIITSSCGSLSDVFCEAMYRASRGYPNLLKDFTLSRTDKFYTPRAVEYKQHVRLYFPSRDTVIHSLGGKESGGTICFNPAYWNKQGFPRDIMKNLECVKQRSLLHSKAIYIHSAESKLLYMGSANMSESAWGKLILARQPKEAKLNVRNWECGVVLKVDEFGDLRRYKPQDGKPYPSCGPWFFQELRQ